MRKGTGLVCIVLLAGLIGCSKNENNIKNNVPLNKEAQKDVGGNETNYDGVKETKDDSYHKLDSTKVTAETPKLGNTQTNFVRGGSVCEYEDWIYFCNKYEDGYIYRRKIDGSERVLLVEEAGIMLQIIHNRLYYINETVLKSVDLEGNNPEIIAKEIENAYVTEDAVYGYVKNQIYRMNIDGTDRRIIREYQEDWVPLYFCLYGDYLLYTDFNNKMDFMALKNDGSELFLLRENDEAGTPVVQDDYLYASTGQGMLYRENLRTGESEELVLSDFLAYKHIVDTFLYYVNQHDGAIYRMNLLNQEVDLIYQSDILGTEVIGGEEHHRYPQMEMFQYAGGRLYWVEFKHNGILYKPMQCYDINKGTLEGV